MNEISKSFVNYLSLTMGMSADFMDYFNGFKNYLETGSTLSEEEMLMLAISDYLFDHLKHKSITLEGLSVVGFKTPNREFSLEHLKGKYHLSYTSREGSRYSHNEECYIVFDHFCDFVRWLRKRNYYL